MTKHTWLTLTHCCSVVGSRTLTLVLAPVWQTQSLSFVRSLRHFKKLFFSSLTESSFFLFFSPNYSTEGTEKKHHCFSDIGSTVTAAIGHEGEKAEMYSRGICFSVAGRPATVYYYYYGRTLFKACARKKVTGEKNPLPNCRFFLCQTVTGSFIPARRKILVVYWQKQLQALSGSRNDNRWSGCGA